MFWCVECVLTYRIVDVLKSIIAPRNRSPTRTANRSPRASRRVARETTIAHARARRRDSVRVAALDVDGFRRATRRVRVRVPVARRPRPRLGVPPSHPRHLVQERGREASSTHRERYRDRAPPRRSRFARATLARRVQRFAQQHRRAFRRAVLQVVCCMLHDERCDLEHSYSNLGDVWG